MRQQLSLQLPEPGPDKRQQVAPGGEGKYCALCNKQMIGLTRMGDASLTVFFKTASPGYVYDRLANDRLSNGMVIPQKRTSWLHDFFRVTLPAFFSSTRTRAQQHIKVKNTIAAPVAFESMVIGKQKVAADTAVLQAVQTIKGRIINEEGAGLKAVSVTVSQSGYSVTSGRNGDFSISCTGGEKLVLTIAMAGYETKQVSVNRTWNKPILVMLNRDKQVVKGQGKVAGKIKSSLLIERIMDTAFNYLKVLPNPADAGASINLEWNKLEEGYYFFQLLNSNGEMVYYREIWIDKEARVMNMELPVVAAGLYYVRLRNKESGKSCSEKLMIQ